MKEKLHRIWRGIFGEVRGINLFLLNSLINEEEEGGGGGNTYPTPGLPCQCHSLITTDTFLKKQMKGFLF